MEKQYILIVTINNIAKYKIIKKHLVKMNCNRFTVIDTLGSTQCQLGDDMEYSSMLWKTLGEHDNQNYNKTIMLVVESEEQVLKIMDKVEAILYSESKKPGTGFMFTIPVYKSHGVRYESVK